MNSDAGNGVGRKSGSSQNCEAVPRRARIQGLRTFVSTLGPRVIKSKKKKRTITALVVQSEDSSELKEKKRGSKSCENKWL